ncbi:MBL fold metallo-hydrolase [Lachnoclostridium phytofermentans]|uniref:Beta-lactamase domain protein n=1 Tax=Lachnoclostridium phytofermentans (strain ATCC 700394 / DSM 18823 / ISDg) TaxID=357809 RepID=A9KR85_LACP7|nr:MBL fold metallo-hydrolase [Lachnoclostridium phytofermentans]ABX40553.1 beta-lactamase domain protein [Lachnoclostridium phytofermentans ISDg]
MYELIQVGEKTYYINCPAKIGIYRINESDVCLIDSGNDKEAGKKVQKILEAHHWKLSMIINTHSHADHIGGNSLLQQRLECPAYSAGIDKSFIQNPVLEPSFLYGGYPCKELRNKFLMAQASTISELTEEVLPEGLEMIRLDGHSFSMVGLKTSDDVWFLADCLTSSNIIKKYHVSFLYDVNKYLETLVKVENLQGKLFIPAHAEPTDNIKELVDINRNKIFEIIELIKKTCKEPKCFEDILKNIFDNFQLTMDFTQYVLVGSTVRSYLSYLHDKGELEVEFKDNKLLWLAGS